MSNTNEKDIQVTRKAIQFVQQIGGEPFVIIKGRKVLLSQLTQTEWEDHLYEMHIQQKDFLLHPRPTVEKYYRAKVTLLIADILLALFFLVIGAVTIGFEFREATSGHEPYILNNYATMASLTSVSTVVGGFLVIFYAYAGWKFAKEGEEQLDEFFSNLLGFSTMLGIGTALMATWLTSKPIPEHRMTYRRTCYIYFTVQAVIALYILARSISRHWAVERIASREQFWIQKIDRTSISSTCPNSDNSTFFYKHFVRAQTGARAMFFLMGLHALAVLSMTAWLLVEAISYDVMPTFHTMYMSYMITLGLLTIVLFCVWIYWTWASSSLDCIFRTHFDAYYLGSLILPVAIIFLLLGYRHVYEFAVPAPGYGYALHSLKHGYWMKIATMQLILLPLFSMSIGKGCCLLTNLFPLAGSMILREGYTDMYGQPPHSLDNNFNSTVAPTPILLPPLVV